MLNRNRYLFIFLWIIRHDISLKSPNKAYPLIVIGSIFNEKVKVGSSVTSLYFRSRKPKTAISIRGYFFPIFSLKIHDFSSLFFSVILFATLLSHATNNKIKKIGKVDDIGLAIPLLLSIPHNASSYQNEMSKKFVCATQKAKLNGILCECV